MSWTMTAFYSKANTPTKIELQSKIEELNYEFEFLEDFEWIDQFGGNCKLNGIETFFEVYAESKEDILNNYPSLEKDVMEFDCGISFISGADSIASACIGIICISLIDLCNAKVIYVDDEVWYTRRMLLDETQILFEKSEKRRHPYILNSTKSKQRKRIKWMDWAILGVLMVSVVLMGKKVISWHLPAILLVAYVGNSNWRM